MSASPPAPQRQPPSVYRRRRIVLLLVLIAIAALVWALIAQPWRGAAADRSYEVLVTVLVFGR